MGQPPLSIAGMVAAVLLGNLANVRQARVGLAIVVVCATTVVYNDPTHSIGSLFFIPALFALGWMVGFALHERSEQTEAAERRAARAELERATAARVAVAEERARIARALTTSWLTPSASWFCRSEPYAIGCRPEDTEDRQALRNVEQAGRVALTEMRQILDAMRRDDDAVELAPQPGLDNVSQLIEDVRAAGLDVQLEDARRPGEPPARLSARSRHGLDERREDDRPHARAGLRRVRRLVHTPASRAHHVRTSELEADRGSSRAILMDRNQSRRRSSNAETI